MQHTIDTTQGDEEVLTFVASRFLCFKRIDHRLLQEVLDKNFPDKNAAHFLKTLIQEQIVKIDNEHLVMVERAALAQLLFVGVDADEAIEINY